MAQTAAKRISSSGASIDYTPSAAVVAGDVVEIGTIPLVATQAIAASVLGSLACEGVFDVPKTSDIFAVGDAVYWNSSGSPVTGTASSGAADNASGNLMGVCVSNANAAVSYVRTKLTAAKRTTTIGGAVTASGIAAEDSSLGITGLTSTGAGGAVVIAGGLGASTYDGGLVSVTGGAGNGASGNGADASLVGGVGGTTGFGGNAVVTGGQGGTTSGAAGAVIVTGGAGSNTAGDGGAVTLTGGAATNNNDNGGAVTINGGAKHGTGNDGAISIGVTNAASITLGKMPRVPITSVAANGANQATAGALSEGWNLLTASDNSKGVVLPSCVNGAQCIVINMVTDKTVLIYPPSGKQVNNAGADNAITVAANTVSTFVSEGANAWYGPTASADVA